MRFSKPKQFWEWFLRNQENYQTLYTRPKKEAIYHMREMSMHLMAYGSHINVELYWKQGSDNNQIDMLFTTYGKSRQFRKVERLVAKAPGLPGWNFLALDPPRPIDYFLDEDYGHLDIDPFTLTFMPPDYIDGERKCCLDVYADTFTAITEEYERAVMWAVYNVLGEKAFGLRIHKIQVYRLYDLPKKERTALVSLQQLPQYIQVRDDSAYYIDEFGQFKSNHKK